MGGGGVGGGWMIFNDTIFRGEQRMERDELLLTEYKGGTIEN